MASANLLALIDDITALLDDVATMTKVAAKKTAGVLGDDLALNAQQVAGVSAKRELPVVWAVAKGSFKNKLILVPLALLLSAVSQMLITVLLLIGGAFLCFEGFEKLVHKFFHSKEEDQKNHQKLVEALAKSKADLVEFEKKKIKGAIRTDFILSAEIIVIALGVMQAASFGTQIVALSTIAILITVGVYGCVAAIVKLDDLGLYLIAKSESKGSAAERLGRLILSFAPHLMRTLSVLGTVAMFAVGGGIIGHEISLLHHFSESVVLWVEQLVQFAEYGLGFLPGFILDIVLGLTAGLVVFLVVFMISKIKTNRVVASQ